MDAINRFLGFVAAGLIAAVAISPSCSALAGAPGDATDFLACKAVSGDTQRLACYDAAASAAPKQAAEDANLGAVGRLASEWTFEDSKSPIDDSPQVLATNSAEDSSARRVALVVRCKEHHTEVYIASEDFWGISLSGQTMQVLRRVNDQPAIEQSWRPGQGSSALISSVFLPGDRESPGFLEALPAAGRIFFRVTDVRGVPHDMTFKLDGVAEVRERVGDACKWPSSFNKKTTPK